MVLSLFFPCVPSFFNPGALVQQQKKESIRALYFAVPPCASQQEKEHLKGCTFLPRVNNEQLRKEPSVKQRLAKLNRLALVMVRQHPAAFPLLGAQL